MASRILGLGDIIGMVDRMENIVTEKEIEARERDAERMLKGEFDFEDFLEQVNTIRKMGSFSELLEMMPLGGSLPKGFKVDETEFARIESMIHSMTKVERRKPELLTQSVSRQRRIARGSGREEGHVQGLLQRFYAMRDMLKALGGGNSGLLSKLPGLKQLSQMNQMKGMNLEDLFGGAGGSGMGLSGAGAGNPLLQAGLPKGFSPPGAGPMRPTQAKPASKQDRNRRKSKRKQQRKSRRRK
jgi:signal recognition particle subunit SRP54